MKIKYFGYNAFIVEFGGKKIAIDPGRDLWLFKLNSLIPNSEWEGITHIFITHGDPDHFDFAIPMTKKTCAAVVCGEMLLDDFIMHKIKTVHELSVGKQLDFGSIKVDGLVAEHGPLPVSLFGGLIQMENETAQDEKGGKRIYLGSTKVFETIENKKIFSRGTIKLLYGLITLIKENVDFARGSIGFKTTIAGKSIINLGDTTFQKEWEGLKPDVLMLPIGGRLIRNTMNETEAIEAVSIIRPKVVIPCHYNCDFLWQKNINPADTTMFKREVEKMDIKCHIMQKNEAIELAL